MGSGSGNYTQTSAPRMQQCRDSPACHVSVCPRALFNNSAPIWVGPHPTAGIFFGAIKTQHHWGGGVLDPCNPPPPLDPPPKRSPGTPPKSGHPEHTGIDFPSLLDPGVQGHLQLGGFIHYKEHARCEHSLHSSTVTHTLSFCRPRTSDSSQLFPVQLSLNRCQFRSN